MIRRNYLALDIGVGQLRAVSLCHKGKGSLLQGGRLLTLGKGVVLPSLRAPNIRDPERFVQNLREVLDPLAGREERIALSLPEASGRLLLTKVDSALKTKAEGIDILKWQLKNSLPVDPGEVQLDYQVLEKNEEGQTRLLVGLVTKSVVEQYEELLNRAGYNPVMIDFHSLNLYNCYRSRFDSEQDFFLVSVEDGVLSLQLFQGGLLRFHRCRAMETSVEGVFREIGRSLVGCQESLPHFRRSVVFLHSDWSDCSELLEALSAAFESEVVLLDPHLDRFAPSRLELATGQARSLVGAIGAAERMM